MSIVLKKGVTGFDSDSFIGEVAVKTFLNNLRFPFIPDFKNCIAPQVSSNFWVIPIVNSYDKSEFDLLINSSFWYIGLMTKDSSWMNHEYMDFPTELTKQIKIGLEDAQLLSKEFLDRRMESHDLSELGSSEIEQIKYWKCNTIGEVIFNGFD